MNTIDLVRQFHDAFSVKTPTGINVDDMEVNRLRVNLLRSELSELMVAMATGDAVEVLDALTDLQYVLDGAYLSLGFADLKNAAFVEVHKSNMTKLGENGLPIKDSMGKVVKGPFYIPPDLQSIVNKYQQERID